jgi:hypothetical protein
MGVVAHLQQEEKELLISHLQQYIQQKMVVELVAF